MTDRIETDCDFAIIGAGPAGMAAANLAAEGGARVVLLDEQAAPGGQIYRAITAGGAGRGEILGSDYLAGAALARGLEQPGIRTLWGATVWRVDANGGVVFSRGGAASRLRARRILVATGALERPFPFPGWTLPGVMTAGAVQILLKGAGIVPGDAVLAGSGPLLYLVASQMIAAGAPPAALVETRGPNGLAGAMRHLPGALRGWRVLAKGASLLAAIRRAGVPRHTGATGLRAEGGGAVEALRFRAGGQDHLLPSRILLIHQGVVPNVQISRSLRLAHDWDAAQRCWRPRLDEWGGTECEKIAIAGDGGGIGGARAAALQGRLAALEALRALGQIDMAERDRRAAPERRALARELAIRPFLDALYAPPREALVPPDETVICRCEEVTAGEVRGYAALGCLGPNQAKAFGRCGMGPCQGRYCGLTVGEVLADARGVAPAEVGYYRLRAPLKPVTLGELASLDSGGAA
ncbi:MAG TPA: NAD(P)/FAD-dependent oxidoreductase [Thermohalobaculum sp.]|nr:NAD(P)/FAD-dependent oxidoreductase [Thermohalobaculum sp.]